MVFHGVSDQCNYHESCCKNSRHFSVNSDLLACSKFDDNSAKERKNSVTERLNNLLESIRLFFGTVTIKPRTSSDMSYSRQCSVEDSTRDSSSGYQSLDNSWEIDDSYIKVSKFTGMC